MPRQTNKPTSVTTSVDEIEIIHCPYDPAHVMPISRFMVHLEKCSCPNKKFFRKCKYNPYHVIRVEEYDHHEKNCPSKKDYQDLDDEWGVESDEEEKWAEGNHQGFEKYLNKKEPEKKKVQTFIVPKQSQKIAKMEYKKMGVQDISQINTKKKKK